MKAGLIQGFIRGKKEGDPARGRNTDEPCRVVVAGNARAGGVLKLVEYPIPGPDCMPPRSEESCRFPSGRRRGKPFRSSGASDGERLGARTQPRDVHRHLVHLIRAMCELRVGRRGRGSGWICCCHGGRSCRSGRLLCRLELRLAHVPLYRVLVHVIDHHFQG